jgi:hypothetical protein
LIGPFRVKRPTLTWTDRPFNVINLPNIKPFNQSNWPIFLKVTRSISNLTVLVPNANIYPIVAGRVICLLADATEYDLSASLLTFELPADATDYDLEADGRSCS